MDPSGEYLNSNASMIVQEPSQELQEPTFSSQKPETVIETFEK